MRHTLLALLCTTVFSISGWAQETSQAAGKEPYLSWTAAQAENLGEAMRRSDKAGSSFTFRATNTNRAVNYKMRATLLTPEVIRASARLEQLRSRLTDEQTQTLVTEAEAAGDLIVMIEIDPNEGSGVVPLDWRIFLQPKGLQTDAAGAIAGIKSPQLRSLKALSGVGRRDYNYDVFWAIFPLTDENNRALLPDDSTQIELLVGIYSKEARVSWQMPESVRAKIKSRLTNSSLEKK